MCAHLILTSGGHGPLLSIATYEWQNDVNAWRESNWSSDNPHALDEGPHPLRALRGPPFANCWCKHQNVTFATDISKHPPAKRERGRGAEALLSCWGLPCSCTKSLVFNRRCCCGDAHFYCDLFVTLGPFCFAFFCKSLVTGCVGVPSSSRRQRRAITLSHKKSGRTRIRNKKTTTQKSKSQPTKLIAWTSVTGNVMLSKECSGMICQMWWVIKSNEGRPSRLRFTLLTQSGWVAG